MNRSHKSPAETVAGVAATDVDAAWERLAQLEVVSSQWGRLQPAGKAPWYRWASLWRRSGCDSQLWRVGYAFAKA